MIHKNKETQRRLMKIYKQSGHKYTCSVSWANWEWGEPKYIHQRQSDGKGWGSLPKEKNRLKRVNFINPKAMKAIKKRHNRKVRYYKGEISNGSCYKKLDEHDCDVY